MAHSKLQNINMGVTNMDESISFSPGDGKPIYSPKKFMGNIMQRS